MTFDISSAYDLAAAPDNSRESWNAYLQSRPDSNFYQRYEWLEINREEFGHRCFALTQNEKGEITAVLPLVFIKSRLFGNILSSMPFVNFGGICAASPEAGTQILMRATGLCEELNADYLEIRSLASVSEALPTNLQKVSLTIDLHDDAEAQWASFKSKHRTAVRRVYKDGVSIRMGGIDLLDDFYQVLAHSWRTLGTPIYRKSYFSRILQVFGDNVKIFMAYQDDKPIATAFNGYYRDTVEGMWAGAMPDVRKTMPNYALYWEMIKHACDNRYRHYHLGRSTANSGAESFKKKWNADSKQLFYQYHLGRMTDLPQLNKENSKYRVAIQAWRKLPLAATIGLGPYLSRNIP